MMFTTKNVVQILLTHAMFSLTFTIIGFPQNDQSINKLYGEYFRSSMLHWYVIETAVKKEILQMLLLQS